MKKFLFITFFILLAGLFAFHFIAANQAEKIIDAAIQEQADSSAVPFSVQYSAIKVSPFSGDVDFNDVTIIEESNIERTQSMHVDLRYIDFLNIYIGGLEYGLKQLESGNINLSKVSYVNRQTLQEFSFDTLNIHYTGNMWDGIRSLFADQPTAFNHLINLDATGGSYSKQASQVGNFTADSGIAHFSIPKGSTRWGREGTHDITFKHLTWVPPTSFQKKYGFFIQGFGYPLDALPLEEMGLNYNFLEDSKLNVQEGIITTELFTANFEGTIATDSTWTDARYAPLNISVVDLSDQFKNVLNNMGQLFGFTLPDKENGMHFQLTGPVSSPQMLRTE